MQLIGRKKQINELKKFYDSGKPELVAIYGRRRVGKTFLVSETFRGRFCFTHTALPPKQNGKKTSLKEQLKAFQLSLLLAGHNIRSAPKTWLDAFYELIRFLDSREKIDGRRLIFIDEIPWLDTSRSNFIGAFTWFWNEWASKREDIMLVVCGSANAWIMNKLINSHDGLFDRITNSINLPPLTLGETKEFLESKGVELSDYYITQLYMLLGGVPFYLEKLERGLPLSSNIDELFYAPKAKLALEYDNLFSATFDNEKLCKRINDFLATKNKGYTRSEIVSALQVSDNEILSSALNALVHSDFITRYFPFGESKKEPVYKLVDPFCLFYQKYVKGVVPQANYFETVARSPSFEAWCGVAFENVCLIHAHQILHALRIEGMQTITYSYSFSDGDGGHQIDLLIDRADGVMNLCEAKFSNKEFEVKKAFHETLIERKESLGKIVSKSRVIHHVLVTTYGLRPGLYSNDFTNVITFEDLFKTLE